MKTIKQIKFFKYISICLIFFMWGCGAEEDLSQRIAEQEAKMEEIWESKSVSPFSEEFQLLIQDLIDSYATYAETHPEKEDSPEYLFKAANYTETYRQDSKTAIEMYERFRQQYPTHEKAGDALFNIGWIYHNSFKDVNNARTAYTSFIEQYPNHKQIESAKFELEHLGMSEDEIFEQLDVNETVIK